MKFAQGRLPLTRLQIANGKAQDPFLSHGYLISIEKQKYNGGGRKSQ